MSTTPTLRLITEGGEQTTVPAPWTDLPRTAYMLSGGQYCNNCRACGQSPTMHSWMLCRGLAEVACSNNPHELTPDTMRLVLDQVGREVLLVPDWFPIMANPEIRQGWREDRASGYSKTFGPDHWLNGAGNALIDFYSESPIPADADNPETLLTYRERHMVPPLVAGFGDWNEHTRWWRDYDNLKHLHLFGNVARLYGGSRTAVRFAG